MELSKKRTPAGPVLRRNARDCEYGRKALWLIALQAATARLSAVAIGLVTRRSHLKFDSAGVNESPSSEHSLKYSASDFDHFDCHPTRR